MGTHASSTSCKYSKELKAAIKDLMVRDSCVFSARAPFSDAELGDHAIVAREVFIQQGHEARGAPRAPTPLRRFTDTIDTRFSAVYTPHEGYTDDELAEHALRQQWNADIDMSVTQRRTSTSRRRSLKCVCTPHVQDGN